MTTSIEQPRSTIPGSVAVLCLMATAAFLLWLPLEFQWPAPLPAVGMIGSIALIALFPGVLGTLASRSTAPMVVLLIGAVIFILPIVLPLAWSHIDVTIRRPGISFASLAEIGILAWVAFAALAGGAVAEYHASRGRRTQAIAYGMLVEIPILLFVLVSLVMIPATTGGVPT